MYLAYDKKNGIEYAKICTGKRVDGKVTITQISLGRVIDKEKHIFHNRARGFFTYDIESDSYGEVDIAAMPTIKRKNTREKAILSFGDAWFLDWFIRDINMYDAIGALDYGNMDSVRAMVMFYVLSNMANCYAEEWLEDSYAHILYPNANLSSQRVSDLLETIGEETSYRAFFHRYFLDVVNKTEGGEDILIDSTGLPNSIHFPLTAISNHNGKISNEVRLIYVVQRESNLPLYFRYIPGNVIDVSTLSRTIKELKAYNVDTKFAILDAGYLTEANTKELYDNDISFISRLSEKTNLYKKLVAEFASKLEDEKNLVEYNGRYVYLIKVRVLLNGADSRILKDDEEPLPGEGNVAYAYVGRDIAMQNIETSKFFENAKSKGYSTEELHRIRMSKGLFVLYSSRKIKVPEVLPKYYTRQQIEQVFDLCKNNTKMLPLRTQTEETFRGHLVLAFIASVIVKVLQEKLKNTKMNPQGVFYSLGNQRCKVFDDRVITCEFTKKSNDLLRFFKLKCPVEITKPNC